MKSFMKERVMTKTNIMQLSTLSFRELHMLVGNEIEKRFSPFFYGGTPPSPHTLTNLPKDLSYYIFMFLYYFSNKTSTTNHYMLTHTNNTTGLKASQNLPDAEKLSGMKKEFSFKDKT